MVSGDFLDAPARCPEGKDVSYPGFIHHFLIKFAHPARPFAATQEKDPEHATVGNGAAACDRDALGTGPGREGSGDAIVDDAGAEFGKVGGGITAASQVYYGIKNFPIKIVVGVGSGDCFEPLFYIPVSDGDGGNGVLE